MSHGNVTMSLVDSDGAVIKDIMQAFFGINRLNDTVKVTATDNKFIADTPNKNGFFRLYMVSGST